MMLKTKYFYMFPYIITKFTRIIIRTKLGPLWQRHPISLIIALFVENARCHHRRRNDNESIDRLHSLPFQLTRNDPSPIESALGGDRPYSLLLCVLPDIVNGCKRLRARHFHISAVLSAQCHPSRLPQLRWN